MRATDIIRQFLDLLDNIENQEPLPKTPEDNESRFKQIFAAIAKQKAGPHANTQTEMGA
jgi:hypothetical protein